MSAAKQKNSSQNPKKLVYFDTRETKSNSSLKTFSSFFYGFSGFLWNWELSEENTCRRPRHGSKYMNYTFHLNSLLFSVRFFKSKYIDHFALSTSANFLNLRGHRPPNSKRKESRTKRWWAIQMRTWTGFRGKSFLDQHWQHQMSNQHKSLKMKWSIIHAKIYESNMTHQKLWCFPRFGWLTLQ